MQRVIARTSGCGNRCNLAAWQTITIAEVRCRAWILIMSSIGMGRSRPK
jgi:nucleoside phosphorylase